MLPTIGPTDGPGLALEDPIENTRFELGTDRPVSPTAVDEDHLYFPVDRAVVVRTAELVVPKLVLVTVRRPDGTHLTEFEPDDSTLVEHGDRLLDISTAPMLLYIRAPGPMTFRATDDAVHIEFDGPVDVAIGCRSLHDRPAATVTVPPSPEPLMRAVSTFGSALKTTSCERSYPTLRGHPPRLELGGRLDVPDALERRDTDVVIEVPPELESIVPVAPLAYYLGAAVRPADRPALLAGDFVHPLGGPGGFEPAVHRTLRRVFFMDSVVRTEGLYKLPLAERDALLERVGDELDLAALYDAPLAAQLEAYLSLPRDAVGDLLPEWPLCVDVAPSAGNIPALPYLVDDLALLRCAGPDTDADLPARVNPQTRAAYESTIDEFVRSDGGEVAAVEGLEETFRLPEAPAIEHAYIGPKLPLGVNKSSLETLRRRLDRAPAEASGISVRIVCNDEAMTEEGVVEEYYGLRELVQFDVEVDYGLSVRDLRGVLHDDVDFLHYIGHIDADGFRCVDGKLNARELDSVGVDSFLLNACTSYEQGQALIDAGALGGVVTTTTVSNVIATAMGQTLARALNTGFTLRSALSLADDHHPTAYRYLVLGDGRLQLVQGESGVLNSLDVTPLQDESGADYEVEMYTYPASGRGLGSIFSPHLDTDRYYLTFGYLDTFRLGRDELMDFLELEILPVSFEDRLFWSDELSSGDVL